MIQTVDVSDIHVLDSESSDAGEKYPKHSTPIKGKFKQKNNPKEKNRPKHPNITSQSHSDIKTQHGTSAQYRPDITEITGIVSPYSKLTQSLLSSPNYNEKKPPDHGQNSLEISTIQKQRQEIQLLVAELRERDQELNEMVTAHQRQLLSWENDRKRLLSLEQKCHRYKGDLLNRSQQLEKAMSRLEDLETRCSSQLESSQEKLTQLKEEQHLKSNLVSSLEDRNKNLNDSLKEVSCTVGQLAAREEEIVTLLKIKDRELVDVRQQCEELSTHYHQMENRNSECHKRERDAFSQSTHWQQKYSEALQQIQQLDVQVQERDEVLTQQISQINEAQQHMIALQEALIVSNEQEKYSNQLMTSLKSKQDRTVSELRSVRELYERQQRELTLLQINLDASHESSSLHTSREHDVSHIDPNMPEQDQSNHSYKISFDDRLSRFLHMDGNSPPTKGDNSNDNSMKDDQSTENSIKSTLDRLNASPGSKLQRLLTESKNMIDSLEQTTLPHSPKLPEQNEVVRVKREAMRITNVDLHAVEGFISSPGFNDGEHYPLNINMTWTLHVPTDTAYQIILNVTFLEIEREPKCGWDFLAFGEHLKEKLCGITSGIFIVDNVLVKTKFRFYSDFYFTQKGFIASYTVHRLPNPCDKSPCMNMSPCTRISSSEYRCTCSQHYTGKNCEEFQQIPCTTYPCLIFEDNFDYLNHKVWQHVITVGGGGNQEFEYYTNNHTNSYCRDGKLFILPTLTADGHGKNFLEHGTLDVWGAGPHSTCTGNAFTGCKRTGSPGNVLNPIQSARLRSSRGMNLKFGKVEVEAKLPVGDWIWPAIWMMPTYAAYGGWPSSGEIDIMESRGNLNYTSPDGEPQGVDRVGSTLHFGPNWRHNGYTRATASQRLKNGSTFADRFYRYAVEWNEDFIRFTIDDEVTLTVDPGVDGFWKFGEFDENMKNPWRYGNKMAPFDQEFYLILNVAVGGQNFFPDSFTGPRPKPWNGANRTQFWQAKDEWYPTWNPFERDGEDAAMKINHVKMWKMKP